MLVNGLLGLNDLARGMALLVMTCFGLSELSGFDLSAISTTDNQPTRAKTSEQRPNILFAISDDQSFPHASAYGTTWVDTPAFDRVAKSGLLFNRCYTPNAKCAPSRACLLTGRNSWQLEEAANHWCYFPEKFLSYVEVLEGVGYSTGMTGKGWAPGVAKNSDGKRELAGKPYSKLKSKPPTRSISANDYATNFQAFLDEVPEDEPFCFWFGASEPHRGYEFGSGVRIGGKDLATIDRVPGFWPDNEVVRNDLLDYALEIEHFDTHLGRMLDELETRGLLDNTLVVVTSDNGMPFPRVKGQEYELSNHLPLAMSWPSGIVDAGRVVNDLVSFIDFVPTYFEIAGVDWRSSGMAELTGQSLVPLFENDSKRYERKMVLIGKERHDIGRPEDVGYPVRGIIKGSFLLLRNFETDRWPAGDPITGYLNTDGSPTKTEVLEARRSGRHVNWWQLSFGRRPEYELFNIETDRDCLENLVDAPRYRQRKELMKELMEQQLRSEGDPRIDGRGDVFDSYQYANVRDRNFYEKYRSDPDSVRAGWVNASDFEAEDIDKTEAE
ncbi:sulfatase [bacterium]|nr:sulfatase [bacterium]